MCLFVILNDAFAAGDHGYTGRSSDLPRTVLVAEGLHGLGAGADKINFTAAANFVEMGILRQKAVPRMDRVDISDLRGTDDSIDLQITIGRLGRSDAIGFVSQFQIGAAPVGLAEDGHGFHAHLAAGAHDAKCDFATICN